MSQDSEALKEIRQHSKECHEKYLEYTQKVTEMNGDIGELKQDVKEIKECVKGLPKRISAVENDNKWFKRIAYCVITAILLPAVYIGIKVFLGIPL